MAVAFDAYSRDNEALGTQSWTHTPVGTPKGILVFALAENSSSDDVTGATYGGVTMTEVSLSPSLDAQTEPSGVHVFFLGSSIPTGAQTVEVTHSGSSISHVHYAVSLTASADTAVQDTTVLAGTAADPSGTLSLGGVSCFAMLGFVSGQNAVSGVTELSGWTGGASVSALEYDVGSQTVGIYYYDTVGTSDVTFGYTATSEEYNVFGIAVKEATSGQTGTGALTIAKVTASGTGKLSHTGTGALTSGATTASGTGTLTHKGTGALTTLAATLAGAGVITHVGTGALTTGAVTISGDGTVTAAGEITGTGALQTSVVTLAGAGVLSHTGTGDLTTGATTISGDGTVLGTITGTGALTTGAVTLYGYDVLPSAAVGGGIGHGGFTRKSRRLVKVEEAESPEEVIAEIERAFAETTKKPVKKRAQVNVSSKPVETPSVDPGAWLDYFREQSRLVRERQMMNDLLAQAKMRVQELQAQETLRRLEALHIQQEEEVLLLLMAA